MYEDLTLKIDNHNNIYRKLNDDVHRIKASDAHSAEDLQTAEHKLTQFIHDYATFLSTYLWDHMAELRPYDLTALNLVPYNVWRQMKEKSSIIVETIEKLYHDDTK